jgi:hypothetical protein
MNVIDTVITDLEMLKNGSWIPDKDSCEASIRMLERAKTEFERMYSEEDMKLAFEAGHKKGFSGYPNTENWKELPFKEWFEQFKKK